MASRLKKFEPPLLSSKKIERSVYLFATDILHTKNQFLNPYVLRE
jgi:hypothetical protein